MSNYEFLLCMLIIIDKEMKVINKDMKRIEFYKQNALVRKLLRTPINSTGNPAT